MIERKMPKLNLQLFAGEVDDEEVENVEVEPEAVELTPEQIREQIKAETLAEIAKENEKKELEAKENKDLENIKEKVKKAKTSVKNTDKEKENVSSEEDKITISNLKTQLSEAMELIDELQNKYEEVVKEKKIATVKNAIMDRLEKEVYLKPFIVPYLNKNMIKSIEDYDNIVTPEIKALLKKNHEREERDKKLGVDPLSTYDEKTTIKSSKVPTKKAGLSDEEKKAIEAKLGIRK